MRAPRHQAEQPCFSARTFIDSVNNVQVALPPASESHHGSNEATSRSRSERNRAHARSAHLQPWAWRAAIDHFSPPTPRTSLKVSEYHVKRMCITSIHRLRRETRPSPRYDHGSAFRGKCHFPQQMSKNSIFTPTSVPSVQQVSKRRD